ncbi:hypothetical protein [Melissospora conviva]|uniref:hypothetical protein n=1 Tax=Melissospora conviva TaxID=3388432 RepID=UPI003C1A4911
MFTYRTTPTPALTAPLRRAGILLATAALGLAVLTACGSDGTATDCRLDSCAVTFDRGVEAGVSVLGVEARLIAVEGDVVTMEIAGQQLSLTAGEQATEVAGFTVALESVDADNIVVRISLGGGEG